MDNVVSMADLRKQRAVDLLRDVAADFPAIVPRLRDCGTVNEVIASNLSELGAAGYVVSLHAYPVNDEPTDDPRRRAEGLGGCFVYVISHETRDGAVQIGRNIAAAMGIPFFDYCTEPVESCEPDDAPGAA